MKYWPDKARSLVSFAYPRTLQQVMESSPVEHLDLLVDSGAFTAHASGKSIDLGEYCEFLIEHRHRITHAVALDVIGDWKATARNHDRIRRRVGDHLPVLPAWHLGSPVTELRRLCREHDYLAIGGCVPYAGRPKLLMQHLIRAHRVAAEHGTLLHGLGITGKIPMYRLPWHSVDSSSWQEALRYGHMALADRRGRFHSIRYGQHLTTAQRTLIRAYDGDPDLIQAPGFCQVAVLGARALEDRRWINYATARSYMLAEGVLRRKHDSQVRVYLATSAGDAATDLYPAWRLGHPFAYGGARVLAG